MMVVCSGTVIVHTMLHTACSPPLFSTGLCCCRYIIDDVEAVARAAYRADLSKMLRKAAQHVHKGTHRDPGSCLTALNHAVASLWTAPRNKLRIVVCVHAPGGVRQQYPCVFMHRWTFTHFDAFQSPSHCIMPTDVWLKLACGLEAPITFQDRWRQLDGKVFRSVCLALVGRRKKEERKKWRPPVVEDDFAMEDFYCAVTPSKPFKLTGRIEALRRLATVMGGQSLAALTAERLFMALWTPEAVREHVSAAAGWGRVACCCLLLLVACCSIVLPGKQQPLGVCLGVSWCADLFGCGTCD